MGTNYIGSGNDLSWCVKDAQDMTSFLKSLGFKVDTYLEKEVTKTKFIYELSMLVSDAINGNITGAVFTHSGHGTQGYNSLETDFYDEGCYFLDGIVWDDQVAEILKNIPDGFPFFIFLDTCFSGGMMKMIGHNKIKFVHTDTISPLSKLKKGLKESIKENAVYISACSEGEYSYDAGDLKNGAATYYLKNAFSNNIFFQNWYNRVRLYLPSDEYPQTPLLICKDDLKLKSAFGWFDPVITNIPDVPADDPPVIVKISFFKRFWNWIKALFS